MQPLIHLPQRHGLYDPSQEKENCGVGFIAHIKGKASHQFVLDAFHDAGRHGPPRGLRLRGQHGRRLGNV